MSIAELTIEQELADQIADGTYGPDPELPPGRSWPKPRIDEPMLPTYESARFGDGPMPEPLPGIHVDPEFVDQEHFERRAAMLGIEAY